MRRFCLLLLLLMFTLTFCAGVSAQDDAAWPIVERCFGDATAPPDGWTFDGTLIMTSPGRLHAYRQEWETPHVLVFGFSGLLSPDARWIAGIKSSSEYFDSGVFIVHTKAIEVYSTVTGENYSVPWEGSYGGLRHRYGHTLYWLDNQHLLYEKGDEEGGGWFVINPFTQSVEHWNSTLNLRQEFLTLSPDSRAIVYANWVDQMKWTLSTGDGEIRLPSLDGDTVAWHPDSQAFATYTNTAWSQPPDQLVLFDLDGNITDRLFQVPTTTTPNDRFTKWSPDAHYLLFEADHLYIANLESQQIIDTCVPIQGLRSAVWSPSSAQFALITFERDDGIQIFDLDTWGRYVVGYHSGDVIGWRAD